MPELNAHGYYPIALRDGEFVAHSALSLHCDSQALRYALSVFEGVRGYRQESESRVRLFALGEHLQRLSRSLELVRLPTSAAADFALRLCSLLERNEVSEDCYLRIAVSAAGLGDLQRTSETTWTASLCPMGRKRWLAEGAALSVCVSSWQKPSDRMFPQAAKNISNYSGPRLAMLEAKAAGFDQPILCCADGHLAEAPTANLFLVRAGVLLTPALSDGVLPGITRAHLLAIARRAGMRAEERSLSREDAYSADEAFLCGTGLELAPIRAVDGRALPESRPVFDMLTSRYFQLVRNQTRPS